MLSITHCWHLSSIGSLFLCNFDGQVSKLQVGEVELKPRSFIDDTKPMAFNVKEARRNGVIATESYDCLGLEAYPTKSKLVVESFILYKIIKVLQRIRIKIQFWSARKNKDTGMVLEEHKQY